VLNVSCSNKFVVKCLTVPISDWSFVCGQQIGWKWSLVIIINIMRRKRGLADRHQNLIRSEEWLWWFFPAPLPINNFPLQASSSNQFQLSLFIIFLHTFIFDLKLFFYDLRFCWERVSSFILIHCQKSLDQRH